MRLPKERGLGGVGRQGGPSWGAGGCQGLCALGGRCDCHFHGAGMKKARWGCRRALEGLSGDTHSDTGRRGPGGDTHVSVLAHCARHFGRRERPGPWDGCGQAPAAALPTALLPPGFCGPAGEMGAPPGLLPAPNEMICNIIKSKPRNRNSYSHRDQKESQAEILQWIYHKPVWLPLGVSLGVPASGPR